MLIRKSSGIRERRAPVGRAFIVAATVFASSTASVTASAEIYKWIDARGVVHYADEAPAGQAAQRMDRAMMKLVVVPASPAANERSRRVAAELAEARRERELSEQSEAQARAARSSESEREVLVKKWRAQCIADKWADCDNTAVLYNRYAPMPHIVVLERGGYAAYPALPPTGLPRSYGRREQLVAAPLPPPAPAAAPARPATEPARPARR